MCHTASRSTVSTHTAHTSSSAALGPAACLEPSSLASLGPLELPSS